MKTISVKELEAIIQKCEENIEQQKRIINKSEINLDRENNLYKVLMRDYVKLTGRKYSSGVNKSRRTRQTRR